MPHHTALPCVSSHAAHDFPEGCENPGGCPVLRNWAAGPPCALLWLCELMKGRRNDDPPAGTNRIWDSIRILPVPCSQKNEVIFAHPPPTEGFFISHKDPHLQVILSWLFCHTQAISTLQVWVGLRIFCQSASVLSLQELLSTSLYSPRNAAKTSSARAAGLLKCCMTLNPANQSSN